jgi:hypothetical protein
MTALDLDIITTRRSSDYDLDVIVDGQWVASAKNNHAADEVGCAVWHRSLLDQPLAGDPPGDNPLGDTEGDEEDPGEWQTRLARTRLDMQIEATVQRNRICTNCQGPHITWQCPSIRVILFAPPRCRGCGDPLDWSGPGLCQVCREWAEPIAA